MSPRRKTAMPSLLIRFWVWIMLLTALSAACSIAMTRLHHGEHAWGLQLLWGADVGWDLTVFRDRFLHFRQPGFWQSSATPLTYPALVGVIFALLFQLPNPLVVYLSICACGVIAWGIWLVRSLAYRTRWSMRWRS